MQYRIGSRTGPRYVSGIGWDFWLIEYNMVRQNYSPHT
ncbi:hypothetical protein QY97_01616 [Bacillus thermotolerans]|nr:hypothetical protein QY97_01616 [Bacillus thermotolerans]